MRLSNNCVNRPRGRALLVLCALGLLIASVALTRPGGPPPTDGGATAETPLTAEGAREAYGQIPLSFEANRGQTDESVNFLARGAGYTLFLKPTEAVFALTRRATSPDDARAGQSTSDAATRAVLKTDAPTTPARSVRPCCA